MVRVIHKVNLPLTVGGHEYRIAVPANSKPLFFANQQERPAVWYERDLDGEQTHVMEVTFIGTGIPFAQDSGWVYLGTAQFEGGNLVLHCYARS